MSKKCTWNSYIYTKNVQTVQNLYKFQTKNGLKLEIYVFCTNKQCTNFTKPIQIANWNGLCMFLYIQTMYKLYKIYTTTLLKRSSLSFLYIQTM